ncbi:hypothetical protein TNCV_2410221 [Trichonephila clavipes]|nr:hypothetical protein TNCV_2410221 [Trichonephila clavipes]
MGTVDFMHRENPPIWAWVESATIGAQGQVNSPSKIVFLSTGSIDRHPILTLSSRKNREATARDMVLSLQTATGTGTLLHEKTHSLYTTHSSNVILFNGATKTEVECCSVTNTVSKLIRREETTLCLPQSVKCSIFLSAVQQFEE